MTLIRGSTSQKFIQDIGDCLRKERVWRHPRHGLHTYMQDFIADLGPAYGFTGVREYRVDHPFPPFNSNGYIDVAWLEDGVPFIVFELDSHFKKKSLAKLLCCPAPSKFWIFIGHPGRTRTWARFADVPDEVQVVVFD